MISSTAQEWPHISAPRSWHTIDFISDLHLHADEPETFAAWQNYIEHSVAQAVFILGDLFEVWVGDDAIGALGLTASVNESFEQRCARTLMRSAAKRDLFFMCGNRDFLIGEAFARACGIQLLHDPSILDFAGQRWLLSHGDALCLADTDYMRFRSQVRGAAWQQDFLGRPLEQRRQIARGLRNQSEAHKRSNALTVDVDAAAATAWLQAAQATCLIHGHTHRPANHELGGHLQRIVLSDWDLRASPARAQVLRISTDARVGLACVRRLAPASA